MANYTGTGADETKHGTAFVDTFDYSQGGDDTLRGLGGDDVFIMGHQLTAADSIDGGGNNDTVTLNGDYHLTFAATTLISVETLHLHSGHDYTLTTNDATVAAGSSLTIDGSALGAGSILVVHGNAETDGAFTITGGAADDSLFGGRGADFLYGGRGGDLLSGNNGSDHITAGDGDDTINCSQGDDFTDGGKGNDTITGASGGDDIVGGAGDDLMSGGSGSDQIVGNHGHDIMLGGSGGDYFGFFEVQDSTGPQCDWIQDFDTSEDVFHMVGSPSAVDPTIMGGTLDGGANFNASLAAAVNSTNLFAHHCVVFAPDMGGLHNKVYLIVDQNGVGGYQADDVVIEVTGGTGLVEGNLTIGGNFI